MGGYIPINEASNLAVEADNYNYIGGEKSWFESAGEALTLGAKGATYSAINSFLDTGRTIGNWFGGEMQLSDTYTELLDSDPEAAQYYKEHKAGVDLAGFAVGSIIPGTAGLKAFNAARGVGGGAGFARSLNLFSAPRDRAITSAMEAISSGLPTIDATLRANKIKAIAGGFGDQALQAFAWETAVTATMGASPVLENQDVGDIAFNLFTGAALGGAIGGVFEGFGLVGKFNKARAAADFKLRPYEGLTNLGKGDYLGGDRVIALIDSLDKIPMPPPRDIEVAATKKAIASHENAMLEARKILVSMSDDPGMANALFDKLWEMKSTGRASNDDLLDYLGQAKLISRMGADAANEPARLTKLLQPDSIHPTSLAGTSQGKAYNYDWEVLDTNVPLTTGRFFTKNEFLTATTDQLKGKYASKTAAFNAGEDLFLDELGKLHVNPNSAKLRKIPAAGNETIPGGKVSLLVNLTTGAITDRAIPVLGDIHPVEKISLAKNGKSLIVDNQPHAYSLEDGVDDILTRSVQHANARYVWAALRSVREGDTIVVKDLPMMDQLLRQSTKLEGTKLDEFLESVTLITEDGNKVSARSVITDLDNIIDDTKRNLAMDLATREGMTADEMALRLNVDRSRIQNGFTKGKTLDEISPDGMNYTKPSHAKITYDVGDPLNDIDGMVARGMIGVQARITRAKDAASTVFGNFMRNLHGLFPEIDSRFSQQYANQEGAGASLFGASNSEYKSPGAIYEAIGAGTKRVIDDMRAAAQDTLAGPLRKLAQDPASSAELGMLTNMLRASPEHYKLVSRTIGTETHNYLVLEKFTAGAGDDFFRQTPKGLGFTATAKDMLPEGYILETAADLGTVARTTKAKYAAYKLDNPTIVEWFEKNVALNDRRLAANVDLHAAQGINKTLTQGRVYAPPIDTRKYKYFAFVREPAGNGASSSSVATITAGSESELASLVTQARSKGFDVVINTKDSIKRWHEAKGDYDFNMNLTENTVDVALKREGVLSNYFPETDAKRVLDDWMTWHDSQISRLVRNHVELKYGQQFAELRDLGRQFTALATAKFERTGAFAKDTARNPYEDYIKAALNLSRAQEYRLWMDANEKVEAFFNSGFSLARQLFPKAASGAVSWEEANKAAQKFGLGTPYVNAAAYLEAQKILPPVPYMRKFIQASHGILSATTLGLDFFNSLVNIISTPILLGTEVSAIRRRLTVENKEAFEDSMRMFIPGTERKMPATTKLIYNAVHNYFADDGKLLAKYKEAGVLPDLLQQHRSMLGDLAYHPNETEGALKLKLKAAVEKGTQLTGNRFAEEFTRFVSANVMDQLTALGGVEAKEAMAMTRTFVNRVQGNVIAAQRPIIFQGVLGQAMGLFQTYQFNLLQQMFRHVANGDKKTVAVMLGLQSTLFGFQGLPLFSALNTHIIGNAPGNSGHVDLFQAIPRLVGKDVGDFMLYGGASMFSGTALYTRGDINPRQISILPINPLDWPSISGITRFVGNLWNVTQKLKDGAPIYETMLQGLEHNSISRPLAGLAQVIQGESTTSQGSLIARTVETGFIATAARLAGSKPVDEAIALDAQYRSTAYKAKDRERTKQLGEAVKTAFAAGRAPTAEEVTDFATKYAAAGGDARRFNSFMIDAAKNATQSVVNQAASNMKDPIAQGMMEIMGGVPLPDYVGFTPSSESGKASFNETQAVE